MTVGTELRQARERAGLSADQISERTKIQLYRIEALENGEFAQLPQGIYLDGIVRAYAHELGIAHEPLVERVRAERGTLPGDWPVPFAVPIDLHPNAPDPHDAPPQDIDILEDFQGSDPLDSFTTERDVAPVTTARPEQREHDPPLWLRMPRPSLEMPAAPQPTRRPSRLLVPLLAVFAAVGLGMVVYQSKPWTGRDAASVAAKPAPEPAKPDAAIGTSGRGRERQPTDVPTRYTENVITPDRASPSKATPAAAERSRTTEAAPPSPPAPSVSDSSAQTPPISNVTGAWTVATHVESSSLSRFEGLKLGYEMRLKQEGDRVTGAGRKVTENGAQIGRKAQTPVTINGKIDGDRLLLNFVERGTRRRTHGKFDLLLDEAGTLRGSFSSNAARSSGRVEAHRVSRE